jgi:hypothetical protein
MHEGWYGISDKFELTRYSPVLFDDGSEVVAVAFNRWGDERIS